MPRRTTLSWITEARKPESVVEVRMPAAAERQDDEC